LESTRHELNFAEAELARKRGARQQNAISESELDEAEYIYRQRSEQFRSSKLAQEIAQFELQQAQAALIRSKPRVLDQPVPQPNDEAAGDGNSKDAEHANGGNGWNLPIYSPINGHVLRVFQESAAVVTPGTPLLELGDPEDLEVEIDVLSRDAVKVKPGDLVLLEHWGGERPLEGHVRVVEPSGFTKISTLGVEEQRVYVIVDLAEPPEKRRTLGDGFRVEARIVIDEAPNALKVPTSALFRAGDQSAVFQVVDGVVREQPVKIGRQNGLEAEILEGLKEGDKVVLHPSDRIEAGVKVKQR
jgi:HlyD family secretion protein